MQEEKELNKDLTGPFNQSYKLRRFTWLIFVFDFKSIRDENLIIPYNCEFITIHSENPTCYKLTEIYMVKNKTFVQNFGNWCLDFGLKIPDDHFYVRRQDMNGSELNAIVDFNDVSRYHSCIPLSRIS